MTGLLLVALSAALYGAHVRGAAATPPPLPFSASAERFFAGATSSLRAPLEFDEAALVAELARLPPAQRAPLQLALDRARFARAFSRADAERAARLAQRPAPPPEAALRRVWVALLRGDEVRPEDERALTTKVDPFSSLAHDLTLTRACLLVRESPPAALEALQGLGSPLGREVRRLTSYAQEEAPLPASSPPWSRALLRDASLARALARLEWPAEAAAQLRRCGDLSGGGAWRRATLARLSARALELLPRTRADTAAVEILEFLVRLELDERGLEAESFLPLLTSLRDLRWQIRLLTALLRLGLPQAPETWSSLGRVSAQERSVLQEHGGELARYLELRLAASDLSHGQAARRALYQLLESGEVQLAPRPRSRALSFLTFALDLPLGAAEREALASEASELDPGSLDARAASLFVSALAGRLQASEWLSYRARAEGASAPLARHRLRQLLLIAAARGARADLAALLPALERDHAPYARAVLSEVEALLARAR